MRCVWLLLWMSAPAGAQDSPPAPGEIVERHAFVEMAAARDAYFVHEPIVLRVRFGLDRRFLETHMVPLFRRHLDVPVQVDAPWLQGLPGATPFAHQDGVERHEGSGGGRLTFALGDGVAEATRVADRSEDGRPFTVLEIERSWLPDRPGELVIPAPLLRFAYATRFEEDVFEGRVAVDRREAMVHGEPLALTIRPLPEEGRPAEFTGAVGRFSVRAEADSRDVEVGESIKLMLRIEGYGNLELFDPPRLDPLEGFHVYGTIDDKGATRRTVTYDLAPVAEAVREVPPIRFAFFDPDPPAGYRTIETEAIPLEVRPLPGGTRFEPLPDEGLGRLVPGETDIFDLKPVALLPRTEADRGLSPALIVVVLLLPWLCALGLLFWSRARERARSDPGGARARAAAAAFRAHAGRPGADVSEALAEYLAARLGCPAAAVIAPDLAARLEAAGVREELSARAAAMLEGLVAARYGGSASADGVEAAGVLVHELELAFWTSRRGR